MLVRKGAGNKEMEGEEVRRKGEIERCGETLAEQKVRARETVREFNCSEIGSPSTENN